MVASRALSRRRSLTPGRIGVIVLALGLTFVGASLLYAGWSFRAGLASAERARAALRAHRLASAAAEFAAAARDFRRSRSSLARLGPGAAWIPGLGSSFRLAQAEAAGAETATAAARDLALLLARLRDRASPLDLRPLSEEAPRFVANAAGLAARLHTLRAASPGAWILPPLAGPRRELLELGERELRTLRALLAAAVLAVPDRRYLLIVENPAELRATGGLIGAWGVLRSDAGKLRLTRLSRNTALPRPRVAVAAPADYLSRYGRFGANEGWVNANMSPDFPTSARVLLALYQAATGQRLDGVLALDAVALDGMIGALGPITAAGRRLTQSSFLATTLVESYEEGPRARTDQLLAAANAGWRRLEAGASPIALGRALVSATRRGHLKAFALDENAQARLAAARLAGTVARPAGDYLLLVKQNAGGNKLDYYFRTRLVETVVLDRTGNARSRLTVELRNEAPKHGLAPYALGVRAPGEAPGLNRTYLSLYSATGARMLAFRAGAERTAESADELGHPVFSWFESVPPQASRTATVTLASPRVARARHGVWTYRLVVQIQPELNPSSLTVSVVLPRGARLRGFSGPHAQARGRGVRFHLSLDHDQTISLTYGLRRQT